MYDGVAIATSMIMLMMMMMMSTGRRVMPACGSQQGPRVGDQGDAGEGHVCGRHHKGKMESTSCRLQGACNHTQVIETACVCVCERDVCMCVWKMCIGVK